MIHIFSKVKELAEISYWYFIKIKESKLSNTHYKPFYTSYFNLDSSFYKNKKILDIGCGPRGSLEWADMVSERVGLDPLVDKYKKLGAYKHKMNYVQAYSENIPFEDNYFDVVCSFNSLDHVQNVAKTVAEIKRVLKPGGLFLLIVDIHPFPTPTEPQMIKWNFVEHYFSGYEVVFEKRLKISKRGRIYENARRQILIKKSNPKIGLLVVKIKNTKDEK